MTSKTTHRKLPKDVRQQDFDRFSAEPLAQHTLSDPSFQIVPMSRAMTHDGTGHTLMAGTWNTEDTVSHLLSFYRPSPEGRSDPVGSETERAECRRMYAFGHMLNAHPGLLHGGVVACILDSTMGNVVGAAMRDGGMRFTAQLNVSYKTPIKTPGIVMTKAWISRLENDSRKAWVEGVVVGGDDGEVVHAYAQGLWIKTRSRVTKL